MRKPLEQSLKFKRVILAYFGCNIIGFWISLVIQTILFFNNFDPHLNVSLQVFHQTADNIFCLDF